MTVVYSRRTQVCTRQATGTHVRLADGQVTVAVGIDVLSLGTLDERNAQFSLQCYFRQFWRDRRLQFNDTVVQTDKPKVHTPG